MTRTTAPRPAILPLHKRHRTPSTKQSILSAVHRANPVFARKPHLAPLRYLFFHCEDGHTSCIPLGRIGAPTTSHDLLILPPDLPSIPAGETAVVTARAIPLYRKHTHQVGNESVASKEAETAASREEEMLCAAMRKFHITDKHGQAGGFEAPAFDAIPVVYEGVEAHETGDIECEVLADAGPVKTQEEIDRSKLSNSDLMHLIYWEMKNGVPRY